MSPHSACLRRRWFCVISQKGRVVQWELGHTCAHVSCTLCRFSRGRVHIRFPCRCSFLPITDYTFLFALHLERFYFDNRAIFCLGDAWEHSFVTTSCCVCGPCHFSIFSVLLCRCILCAVHRIHDNWVAYFRTWSRRSLHRFCGRTQTYGNQSDVFNSPKPCYATPTFETKNHCLE